MAEEKKQTHTIYGKLSLFIGFFGIIFPFIYNMLRSVFPFNIHGFISIEAAIGALAMMLGIYSYLIKKPKDSYGIFGFIFGLAIIIMVCIFLWLESTIVY